jgi:F0F1-type ATP synthase assembly protein I
MKDLLSSTPLLQVGWIVALSTLIPLGLGVVLDRRLGTAPLFIIIGAAIGILASTVSAVRITTRTIDALGNRPPSVQPPPERSDEKED